CKGSVAGDAEARISGIRTFAEAGPSDLVLVSKSKFVKQAGQSLAAAFLVGEDLVVEGRNMLRVANPKLAFARLLSLFYPLENLDPGVHPTACVEASAHVAPSARIGAFCYIGSGCRLAAGCQVFPGAILLRNVHVGESTRICANVSIYPGVEIGR